jgi:hypothetical protein
MSDRILGEIVSSVSKLNDTMSQIVSWIRAAEDAGVFPPGLWERAGASIEKNHLISQINEIKSLLTSEYMAPDLEDLLTAKLNKALMRLEELP